MVWNWCHVLLRRHATVLNFSPHGIIQRHFTARHKHPSINLHANRFTQFDPGAGAVGAKALDHLLALTYVSGSGRGQEQDNQRHSQHDADYTSKNQLDQALGSGKESP